MAGYWMTSSDTCSVLLKAVINYITEQNYRRLPSLCNCAKESELAMLKALYENKMSTPSYKKILSFL